MTTKSKIKWLSDPEEHDYDAALSYLCLLYGKRTAKNCIKELKRAETSEFQSKDIFRAARLPLLPVRNSHVKKDQQKIQAGRKIPPLLLIRKSAKDKVVIADGYHRLCAVYSFDEDAVIPCKIC